jgi:hypothetical protein
VSSQWFLIFFFLIVVGIISALGFIAFIIGIFVTLSFIFPMTYVSFAGITRLHEYLSDGFNVTDNLIEE